ncbi:MAG: serine/threonine-protein kinase [Pirellulales bacterium]
MQIKSCPAANELKSFVRCDLPESQLEAINAHLQECPQCEATVEGLERQGDTVVNRLRRSASQQSYAGEPECQALLNTLVEDATLVHAPAAAGSPTVGDPVPVRGGDANSPDRLRDYRLLDKLGEGGMGAVYRAQHLRLKRTVAVKILPSNRLSDPQSVARFEREMEVLGQLNHPHIVQALDAGEHDGRHYLVMEYVEGLDLGVIVKTQGPLRIADACRAISEAALGLQYAHEHGYVHRDIKPSNLMVAHRNSTTDGSAHVKILDLGLARALADAPTAKDGAVELTATSQVMGTLDYMAPEQGGDAHQVDIRADIYSLGATLYKLLTGHSPFAEYGHKPPMQRLMAMAASVPPPVQSKRADIPAPLAVIVHRMLGKQPDERFATPAEVVTALAPFCEGADLGALLVATAPSREARSAPTHAPAQSPTSAPTRNASQGRVGGRPRAPLAVALSFGAAALVALGVILAVATRHGTVIIESPDGKLPDDVRVAVAQGGEEVAVLQADNQWSAKVVNGEYQLQVRGGDDRFELQDSRVQVSRMGRRIVEVHVKKPAAEVTRPNATNATSAVASGNADPTTSVMKAKDPPASTRSQAAVASDRPFVLVRDGQLIRAFKSLMGAIADQKSGDVIEVRSNEALVVELPSPTPELLSIRAGSGFRPRLRFKPSASSTAIPASARWSFAGCDLDLRQVQLALNSPEGAAECQLVDCGVWGGAFGGWAKFTATDCILIFSSEGGFYSSPRLESEVVLENCALQNRYWFFTVSQGTHKLVLRHCTYYEVDGFSPSMVRVAEGAMASIEASHCVFHRYSQNSNLIVPGDLPRVTWNGNNNCFSGHFSAIGELQPDGSWKTLAEGLANWKKQLKGSERDSIERPLLALEWGRIQRLGEGRLAEIARAVQPLLFGAESQAIGPDWSFVGAGDAYVRALAAAGRPVAEDELRPEQLPGGPFRLLVEGAEPRGFSSITAALAETPAKMATPVIIEIRGDGPFPVETVEGKSRRIVLRAAPGFRPKFDSLAFTDGAQVELEGLVIQNQLIVYDSPPTSGKNDSSSPMAAKLIRAMNCEFIQADSNITARLESELLNCSVGSIELLLEPANKPAIRNCVAAWIATTTIGKDETTKLDQAPRAATLLIERCLLFQPEQTVTWMQTSLTTRTPTRIESRRSIYIAPLCLLGAPEIAKRWSGDDNWFQMDGGFLLGATPADLAELQKISASDANSRQLLPWQFDPRQWRIISDEPLAQGVDTTRLRRTTP